MDINELESYRLQDAVKFHKQLNPRLWGADEHLQPDVKSKLLAIADDFCEFLGITGLEIKDITVSGSNAAYTYTDHSDIDLHIVVDLPESKTSDIYQELFDAKKYQYNDQHDFKIGGYDVELYVQDANKTHHSQGIYSLLNNDWVRVPSRRQPSIDDMSVRNKYEDIGHRIDAAIKSGSGEQLENIATKVRNMRQSGLDKTGEFGPENLAFKILRNNGTLDILRQARLATKDREMSLEAQGQPKERKKYGHFGGTWFPSAHDAVVDETELVKENPLPKDIKEILLPFVKSCAEYLKMEKTPKIVLKRDPEWTRRNGTFGQFDPDTHSVTLAVSGRHTLDILRTLAHELTHARQDELATMPVDAGATGSPYEDDANTQAGRIMRHWVDKHPEFFKDIPLEEDYDPKGMPRLETDPTFNVNEAQISKNIQPILVKKGYTFLGKGQDQDAYLAPDGTVLKIFGYGPGGKLSQGQQSFKDFADYCMAKPNNPFLPQFGGWEPFDFEGKRYLQIKSERMFDLSKSGLIMVGSRLGQLASLIQSNGADRGVNKFLRRHGDQETGKLVSLVGGRQQFLLLATTIEQLDKLAGRKGYRLDLHGGNFMIGSDGEIVINDPFFTGSWRFDESINESLDQPYKILRWEQGDFGDVDAIARLDDGTFLSIMFNKGFSKDSKEEAWSVEFYRNNSQAKTGEGDQQRVFATVLSAIQTFIKKYTPNKITFSASKEVEPDDDQRKALTRARLYDSLVQRYARAWGYRAFRADNGNIVIYELSRLKPVTEGQEKFNTDLMKPGFKWSEEINGITYLVRTQWDNMPEVVAKVNNREVGRATFIDHHTRSGLESVSTYVNPKWQGHGIAKNMYAVVRMLGANIQPSATQTAMGKDMWAKWKKAGDTKHLTSLNAKSDQPGLAENMDHSKDSQAVEELKAALIARKQKLQSASDNQVYDTIDSIMTRIAKSHSISGQQLHDMWVDKYKQIPDTWIMHENFADGKNPGRKGLAKRVGVNTKASVSSLRKTAKHSTGEKQRMAHWLANMKAGRAKHEDVTEAVTDNYLYHATMPAGMMRILRTGAIKATDRPQPSTKARTQYPTISTTRSKQYAESDEFVDFLNLTKDGNAVILVFDRNAVANHYKMFGTSQGTQTVGDEFEEVIVAPKGSMPIRGTLKGFYFNPNRTAEIQEYQDVPWFQELLTSPYYMGPKQGVAEQDITRRGFLKGAGAAAVAGAIPGTAKAGDFKSINDLNKDPESMEKVWRPRMAQLQARCANILKSFISVAPQGMDAAEIIQNAKLKITLGEEQFKTGYNRVSWQKDARGNVVGVPSGEIFLDTTVFWDAPDEVLAFILGHELGHFIFRHGMQVGDVPVDTSRERGRRNELEADNIGAFLARQIGYNKAGYFKFLFGRRAEYMTDMNADSTHPSPAIRAKSVNTGIGKKIDFELSNNAIKYIDSAIQQFQNGLAEGSIKQGVQEATGFIPVDSKLAHDPRYVSGLTVDIKPGETQRQAKKLGWTIDKNGNPPLLMQELERQWKIIKEGREDLAEQDLFEIKMTGKNLRAEAAKTGAQAGMEFEMIVPNVENDDEEQGDEADYEYDESVSSIQDAYDFFYDGAYNSRGDVTRLREKMQNEYYEWLSEQFDSHWESNEFELVYNYIKENASDEEIAEILGTEPNEDGEYPDANKQSRVDATDKVIGEGYSNSWYEQAQENAQEDFRNNANQESEWLEDRDLNNMSDIENEYGMSWPHRYSIGGGGELSIDDVADEFSRMIGKPINASERYHGARREPGHYVVEPDGSLTPDDSNDAGLEFVSPPMPIDEMISDFNKVVAWAKKTGCYTNDSTGLHINVSVPNFDRRRLDFVKLAILMGDEYVLDQFGRNGNFYTKSAMKIVKDRIAQEPANAQALLDKMKGQVEELASRAIHAGYTEKYTSINVKDGYIEFRSAGGDWLDSNLDKVENTLLRFTVALNAAMNPEMYREEYLKKLYKILAPEGSDDSIKYFAKYAAGELPQSALKSFIKQAQLERKLKADPTNGQKYWWRVDKEGRGKSGASIEVVATSKEEALEKAASNWNLKLSALSKSAVYPIKRFEDGPITRYEIYNKQTGNSVEPADGITNDADALVRLNDYIEHGPHSLQRGQASAMFGIRRAGGDPVEPIRATVGAPQPAGSVGRAATSFNGQWKIIDGLGRQLTVFRPYENTRAAANELAAIWARENEFDGNYQVEPADEQQSTPAPGSTTDLAQQRSTPGTFTGAWRVVDSDTGQELYRFSGVGNVQADANRVAADWLRQNALRINADMRQIEVLPIVS